MRGFFNGWRRKLGCVTLVVALLFMGGWVRSFSHEDELALILFHRVHSLGFEPGWISWWSWSDPSEVTWPPEPVEWNTRLIGSRPDNFEEYLAELKARPNNHGGVTVVSFLDLGPWSRRRSISRAPKLRETRERRRRDGELFKRNEGSADLALAGFDDWPEAESPTHTSTGSEGPALEGDDDGLPQIVYPPVIVVEYPEIVAAKLSLPYWVIVNSFALLSAWLFLSKRRVAKQKIVGEN